MKAFRTLPGLMALVLVLVLAAPASAGGSVSTQADDDVATYYDGQALMTGLFFGIGPVGALFPEFNDAEAQPVEILVERVDSLINRIADIDPAFFAAFAEAIQSGDRPTILNALESAQQALRASILAEFDLTEADLESGEATDYLVCIAFWVAAAITLAAVGNVAYAVNLAYEGNIAWTVNWAFGSVERNTDSALARDLFVNSIATRLGA